jgi:hypothetical protein
MSMPFDATLKDLVQRFPQDYGTALGLTGPAPLTVLNVDLSTITAATDIVLGMGDPLGAIVDLNFQAARSDDLDARVLLYSALLYHRYRVPVHSVVVLLRPAANDPSLDTGVHYAVWPERGRVDMGFEVERLWTRPVEQVLAGGLGTLPLAPLCRMPADTALEQALPGVIRQIDERLTREARPEDAATLWTAAFVLSGMRLSRRALLPLFQGVRAMNESDTYQYIVEEGLLKEARKFVLRHGERRLGAAPESVRSALEAIPDLERLERMSDRALEASSWQEILETP